MSQANIPYWKRDNLRNLMKGLKKPLDDLDKARKASVMGDVSDTVETLYNTINFC